MRSCARLALSSMLDSRFSVLTQLEKAMLHGLVGSLDEKRERGSPFRGLRMFK